MIILWPFNNNFVYVITDQVKYQTELHFLEKISSQFIESPGHAICILVGLHLGLILFILPLSLIIDNIYI